MAKTPALTQEEINGRIATLPNWEIKNGILSRTFTFADFVQAMQFVDAVADAAESANHHPDIDIRYNKITLGLITHDSGGITEKDFALAAQSDSLAP